jgi:NAD(P)-dependent dehydrogenase (short-subunit alcohol dehydrogenase family)
MTTIVNKNCFITGATNGIGKETAIALAQQGMQLFMMVRNPQKGEQVKQEIARQTGNHRITLLIGDMEKLGDVRRVASEFLALKIPLHVLVNNAGVVKMPRGETADGFETMFGVNHLAPFLLTNLLLPALKAGAPSRIVVVASDAHRFVSGLDFEDLQTKHSAFKGMKIYGASKLCNIYFMRELARRLEGSGVTVNALHPGWVATGLGANNGLIGKILIPLQKPFARSPKRGAESTIYLASSPKVEGISGQYYFNCREHKPSAAARDDEAAKKLWVISEQLCGLATYPH